MAEQQHPFSFGFPNVQKSPRRTQFNNEQTVSGFISQQRNMVSSQQFGMGVGVGVGARNSGSDAMGMSNSQQILAQQQQQQSVQRHMQMQQQLQLRQQLQLQQQQAAMVQQNNQATTSQIPVPPAQPPPRQQQNKEFNIAFNTLGQETVQEIVSRALDFFQTLEALYPPNGAAQGEETANEKKKKVHDQLQMIKIMFKRLRLIYERCSESCQLQGMEYTHIESLIPLKGELDMKSDEKKKSEAYRLTCKERDQIMEQVILKNRHIKEVINHLRRITTEINTMLAMRRS